MTPEEIVAFRRPENDEWLLNEIRVYGRQERAAGLRAAARKARRYAEVLKGLVAKARMYGPESIALEREYGENVARDLARRCDRHATKIAKGKR